MKAPIIYTEGVLSEPDLMLKYLKENLAWVRHMNVPRAEYHVAEDGTSYTYGKDEFARTYETQPLNRRLSQLWDIAEKYAGCKFDRVFLNRYMDQSDHLGWHHDTVDPTRPVAVISLGVEREIWFRRKDPQTWNHVPGSEDPYHYGVTKQKLGNGSLIIMPAGMQEGWQHRIPKASFQCGERISLTFRGDAK